MMSSSTDDLNIIVSFFLGKPGITVHRDGHLVSRISDFILYSVEAEFIDSVVEQYGPCKILTPTHPTLVITHLIDDSNKIWRNRRRTNVGQSTRKSRVRKAPPAGRTDCLLPLPTRTYRQSCGPTSSLDQSQSVK
jgi:hypothetical protein